MEKKGNIKILLADDDEDDRYFFRRALLDSGVGVELTAVSSGQKLLNCLLAAPEPLIPDVIFLDINMPGMDGKVCLREIRRHEGFSAIPIIMLSTSTRLGDIEETFRDGANKYISKTKFYTDGAGWMLRLFPADWQDGLFKPLWEKFAFID